MNELEPLIDESFSTEEDDEFLVNSSETSSARIPRMWDAKIYTDNILAGYAIWSESGENEFGHAISSCLEFQFDAAMKGYFVRGGFAVGNLFMN